MLPDLADLLSPDIAMTAVMPIAITARIANAIEMLRRFAFVALTVFGWSSDDGLEVGSISVCSSVL